MKPRPLPDYPRTPGGRITEDGRTWFFEEVRRGRNPFKVGEQLGLSRPTVRNLMQALKGQFVDGQNMSPLQLARAMQGHIDPDSGNVPEIQAHILSEIPEPIVRFDDLSSVAQQAYKELGFWRKRFLGRRNIEWQIEMCLIIMDWLYEARRMDERVRGVVNTPPGGGKTTTITHDFPGWMISRERNIRIALGSRTTPQSTAYVRRLKNTLEKNTLLNLDFGRFKPEDTEVWRQDEFIVDGVTGSAASLEYRLALAGMDYEDPQVRRRLEDPTDEIHQILKAIESVWVAGEKEPTVKALSQQMGFLGGRFDLNLWDDLVDDKNSKTPEHRNTLSEWWEEYAVSRAEPGGIIALIGTRFGKYDLFRHCRDMSYAAEEELEDKLLSQVTSTMSEEQIEAIREDLMREMYDNRTTGEQAAEGFRRITPRDLAKAQRLAPQKYGEPGAVIEPSRVQHKVYRYVKFPAHDEEKCPAPTSLKTLDHIDCVLDPKRFKWRDLMRAKESNPRKFNLTYQQLDESTEDNLIQEVWLTGGTDDRGIVYPGCFNYGRRLLEIPPHLEETHMTVDGSTYIPKQDCYSIATVDPSAVNYWSIQWWVWDERNDKDYLVDILRARLSADSFLSYSTVKREYHGVMDRWQQRSVDMGWPISLWIIESVAAQRYLFQHTWVNEWMKEKAVNIKGHETSSTKADEEYGIQILRPRYRTGSVDLPYTQDDMRTRAAVSEFKQELVEWPDGPTDDMVNGHWFLEANRYKLPKGLKVQVNRSSTHMKHPFQDTMPERLAATASPGAAYNARNTRRPEGHRANQRRS